MLNIATSASRLLDEQIRICHKRTKRQYKGRGKEVFNPYGADLVDMSKYHSMSLDEKVKKMQ